MSLNITGKDWREIHNLVEEIKQKTNITSPFVEYVNNMESSGATFDLSNGQYVFFDDIVYLTNLDYSFKNIRKNLLSESEPNSAIFNNLLNQLILKLEQARDKSSTLVFDLEKQKQSLLKFYEDQYTNVLDYKPPIKLPSELQEKFTAFVPEAKQYLPGYGYDSLKNQIIKEIIDNIEKDEILSAKIACDKYHIYKWNEQHLYNPGPEQMLEILFIILFKNRWYYKWREICQKYNLPTDNDQLKKHFQIYDNEIQFVVFQIWKEVEKQTPDSKYVKKIKSIVDSKQSYEPKQLFSTSVDTCLEEGSRIFIDLIAFTAKELLEYNIQNNTDDENLKLWKEWLKEYK